MTQFEHNLIASLVGIILWFVFLKPYFVTKKEVVEWEDIIKKYFG